MSSLGLPDIDALYGSSSTFNSLVDSTLSNRSSPIYGSSVAANPDLFLVLLILSRLLIYYPLSSPSFTSLRCVLTSASSGSSSSTDVLLLFRVGNGFIKESPLKLPRLLPETFDPRLPTSIGRVEIRFFSYYFGAFVYYS